MRALILLLVVGCGSAARPLVDAAPVDGGLAAIDSAVDASGRTRAAFVDQYCARLGPCCAAIGRPGDGSACRAALAGEVFQPALGEACLTSLQLAASTVCLAPLPPACTRVFSTVVASGQPGDRCTADEQCLLSPFGPVTCAGGSGSGHCQVLARGRAGDTPCAGTVDGPLTVPAADPAAGPKAYLCAVADGLWCDDATHACAAHKSAGATCTSFGECGVGFTCDDASGTCVPRKREGDTCAVDEECPSTICRDDDICAPPPVIGPAVAPLCEML